MPEDHPGTEQLPGADDPSGAEALEHVLARVVLQVPGVVRLEPSLSQAVSALRRRQDDRPAVLVRRRGHLVRLVRTDLVVDDGRSAAETAADVRSALRSRLEPDVRVEVLVLGVEPR